MNSHLPLPSQELQQHSQQLITHICQRIALQGRISFADYMQMALYEPGLGYYSAGMQKFGVGGDFITAPEISPLFAQCLAQQIQSVATQLGNSDILEIGAGSGQLAVDLLATLATNNALPAHYYILELSAELRDRQQQKLAALIPQYLDRITWCDHLPTNLHGVIIANEVIDAMPIRRFCYHDNQLFECYVTCDNQQLNEVLAPPGAELTAAFNHLAIETTTQDYTSEINLLLPGWLASLGDSMISGLVLLIDYGFPCREYYHPDRSMGTLMCHYQHRAHSDPYFWPGLQDITAHVDFTAVAEAAVAAGFTVSGYTTQANFLLNCGLTDLATHMEQ